MELRFLSVVAVVLFVDIHGFVLDSIEQRPSYPRDDKNEPPEAPMDVRSTRLNRGGFDATEESSVPISRYTYIGCFEHDMSITVKPVLYLMDPNACLEICLAIQLYKFEPTINIVAAVLNGYDDGRCGCALRKEMQNFIEVEQESCDSLCADYKNNLCGGSPNKWGLFMQYDHFSLSGQGAYDPWRYIFYNIVSIRHMNIIGAQEQPEDGSNPNRYYVHAVDAAEGRALFQYQKQLVDMILYGMQYDIDSSMLVSLATDTTTGRMRTDLPWKYKLCTIKVNTTDKSFPRMELNIVMLQITEERADVTIDQIVSDQYFSYTGASAIFSKDSDVYVFTQALWSPKKSTMKDRIYVVTRREGQLIFEAALDFKAVNLYSNQAFGDLSAIGPRLDTQAASGPIGRQSYVYLGRIYRSTTEGKTIVDWQYNVLNPFYLAAIELTENYHLYPGVADSEHLANKSAIVHRLKTSKMPWGALTITEVHIRSPFQVKMWCNGTTEQHCQGTINKNIPYASVFNVEPGIPLSLKAPQFVSPARFNMDASAITVTFDRSTTQGAKPIDENGDLVPDRIDNSFKEHDEFDCAKLFSVVTAVRLGPYPSTTCLWKTNAEVRIALGEFNISVGDSLYILMDTLYAPNKGGEWSPATTGGVQVDLPDPLIPPVIIPSGSEKIDMCTPVRLDVDAQQDGGQATWAWVWIEGTETDPNPADLANRAGWTFDLEKLELFKEYLTNSTLESAKTLQLPAKVLQEASLYRIKAVVTSRWGLTTEHIFNLEKLSFPAPTVFIRGENPVEASRVNGVSLEAVCENSDCAPKTDPLAFRWFVTSQSYERSTPLDFTDHPDIVTTAATLIIPEMVLEPTTLIETDDPVNVYNITVECYVDTVFGNVPEKTASKTRMVRVPQSELKVKLAREGGKRTISDLLVMDGRSSHDLDYPPPTSASGHTFRGTFLWRCLTPEPERKPCWEIETDDGVNALEDNLFRRRLQATDGYISVDDDAKYQCRTDVGNKTADGQFEMPLFDGSEFCSYARGVLMVKTDNFKPGGYKFSVKVTSLSGDRQAEKHVIYDFVSQPVPKMKLEIATQPQCGTKWSITRKIKIKGSEQGVPSPGKRTYEWRILLNEKNDVASTSEGEDSANDPDGEKYDENVFVDKTKPIGDLFDISDPLQFEANPNLPILTILENTLRASSQYQIKLITKLASIEGDEDIQFETAGGKPKNGKLIVEPLVGYAAATERTLRAEDWKAGDDKLFYQFGFIDFETFENGTKIPGIVGKKNTFKDSPGTVKEHTVSSLKLGYIDSTGSHQNYTVPVYVEVCTKCKACETVEVLVVSSPPPDDQAANLTADGIKAGERANGVEKFNHYTTALSVGTPSSNQIVSALGDIISADVAATSEAMESKSNLCMAISGKPGISEEEKEMIAECMESVVNTAVNISPEVANDISGSALVTMARIMVFEMPDMGMGGMSTSMVGRYKAAAQSLMHKPAAKPDHFYTNGATRQLKNHKMPSHWSHPVKECPSPFCDRVDLWCITTSPSGKFQGFRCCPEVNPHTLCNEPPCWFGGAGCPSFIPAAGVGRRSTRRWPGGSLTRRLDVPEPTTSLNSAKRNKPSGTSAIPASETWFDLWVGHNFPTNTPAPRSQEEVSEYNRVRGFHGWHPKHNERRLDWMEVNDTISVAVRLQTLEDAEAPFILSAQDMEAKEQQKIFEEVQMVNEKQLHFDAMTPETSKKLKAEMVAEEKRKKDHITQFERNASQRITRIVVMRDTLCKSIISSMVANERPKEFDTMRFKLTIGKTPDLTNAHSHFRFPGSYFKRPADSPDDPTPLRPLTGFSYIYVEYWENIYGWSKSNPVSNLSSLVTLIVLGANTKDLDIPIVDPPIKMYQQFDLFSSAQCLYWDRFAPNTAGGEWSAKGISNDGDSCITTHLSDVAVFMDGRMPSGSSLVEKATSWSREVWESHCIGCESGSNLFPVTGLGMVLFTLALLILLGYVQDERRRTEMKKNKVKSMYFYDGDGLVSALNVDDPIAYSLRDVNMVGFWIGTLVNVAFREHAVLGPIYYHEIFTRPQRLICLMAMLTGLLAINAAFHSEPGYLQQAREFIISGTLSGLFVFPIYCGLLMMFNMRPAQVKKRLIKKTYSTRELDVINDQRRKLAQQTALYPPPGYTTAAQVTTNIPGQIALLNMPAPLPLPPLPLQGGPMKPGQVNLALPGSGGFPGFAATGGGTGMLALPPFTSGLPPPPPKNAKAPSPATLMPPINFPKIGPPPQPLPALMAPAASIGGTNLALPFLPSRPPDTPPDTGATPLQLPDLGTISAIGNNLPNFANTGDTETLALGNQRHLDDPVHGMMPPGFSSPQALTPPSRSGSGTPATPSMRGLPPPPPRAHGTQQILARDAVPPPLFIRGTPPPMLPTPFPPQPSGPSGISPWAPPGIVPSSGPPVPTAHMGNQSNFGIQGVPLPNIPPVPPPPPREEGDSFVRRIKLTYMDKVTKEHDKYDLLEDYDELGKDVPFWVFDTMAMMPYLAACTFTLCAIFVVLQYSVKFQKWQEEYWMKGTLVGLIMNVGLLELLRIIMMTLVELRKFENRRKAKAGDFLPRRVRRVGDTSFTPAPMPRLWRRAVAAPQLPKGKPSAPRPVFLPAVESVGPGPSRQGGVVAFQGNGPPRIPVAPARPPVFSAAAMARAGALDEPPAPDTPHEFLTNPRSDNGAGVGFVAQPKRGITPPSTGNLTPPLQSVAAAMAKAGNDSPKPLPSPAHSTHSLTSLAQSLNQQVKAGKHAEPPPPPPAQPGASPQSSVSPPPAPAAPPPNYSRPPSRPSSASSVPKAKPT